jgi:LysR family nitrogen assimilation transcriptional regulator
MDERQLRGFLAILELGSVSKAAASLGQAQPSVSQLLLRLEDELGSKLFERTSRGVVPTPAGALFREPATRILAELARAREELSDQRALHAQQTRIGMPPPVSALFDRALLSRIEETVPLSSIAFRESTSEDVKRWIDDDVIDFGLLYNVEDLRNALIRPIFSDELMLISRRGDTPVDDFGIGEETVDLGEDTYELILAERHNGMRRFIEAACQRDGVQIHETYTVNSFQVVRSMLLMGHGHAILPHTLLANEAYAGQLMARRITRPNLERVIYIVRNMPAARRAASLVVEAALVAAMMSLIRERRWFAKPIDYAGV